MMEHVKAYMYISGTVDLKNFYFTLNILLDLVVRWLFEIN